MIMKKAKKVFNLSMSMSGTARATVQNNVHLLLSDRKSNSLGSAKIGINLKPWAKTCRDPVMQINKLSSRRKL